MQGTDRKLVHPSTSLHAYEDARTAAAEVQALVPSDANWAEVIASLRSAASKANNLADHIESALK